MNEKETRVEILRIINDRIDRDLLSEPTNGKDAVVEHHIKWIKSHSDNAWDEQIAAQRVVHLKKSMESD